jgi:hypothetical protein
MDGCRGFPPAFEVPITLHIRVYLFAVALMKAVTYKAVSDGTGR